MMLTLLLKEPRDWKEQDKLNINNNGMVNGISFLDQ